MFDKIKSDLVESMKKQNKFKTSVLRMLKSSLQSAEIDKKSKIVFGKKFILRRNSLLAAHNNGKIIIFFATNLIEKVPIFHNRFIITYEM